MPGTTGWEVLSRLYETVPQANIVVFSSTPEIDERHLVRSEAFNFVPKGGDLSVIVGAIKEASLSTSARAGRITTEAAPDPA